MINKSIITHQSAISIPLALVCQSVGEIKILTEILAFKLSLFQLGNCADRSYSSSNHCLLSIKMLQLGRMKKPCNKPARAREILLPHPFLFYGGITPIYLQYLASDPGGSV